MSASQTKTTLRMVAASFAAGASAMVLFGLVAPVAVQGGLSVGDAIASQEAQEQLIEPLDVAAIQAQLAEAEAEMNASRARTDSDMKRLERLSGRR